MSKILSTGYLLKTNNANTAIDLTGASHFVSARVKWKGIDTNFSSTVVNSTTYPPNLTQMIPYVESGYDFALHNFYGNVYFTNNHPTDTIDVRSVLITPETTVYGVWISLPPGESASQGFFSSSGNYMGGNTATVGGSVSPAGQSSYIDITTAWSVTTSGNKKVKTTNPAIKRGSTVVKYTGTLNADEETSWINITFSLTPKQLNNITNNFDAGSRAYVDIEYTFEPILPAPEKLNPENDLRTTDSEHYFEFTLTEDSENSATKYHAKIMFDKFINFNNPTIFESETDQTDWEYWTGATWSAFPSDGVNPGTKIRYQYDLPDLGIYYWDVQSKDDYDYSLKAPAWKIRILMVIVGLYYYEIETVAYKVYDLQISETSNGELGQIIAILENQDGAAFDNINFGDEVLCGFNDSLGNSDEFKGVVRSKEPMGNKLVIYAITGDGILAERIVKEDYSSTEIGTIITNIINTYCSPLTASGVDTSTGFSAPIPANNKTPLKVLEEIRKNYNLFFNVDKDWDLDTYKESAITEPTDVIAQIKYGD